LDYSVTEAKELAAAEAGDITEASLSGSITLNCDSESGELFEFKITVAGASTVEEGANKPRFSPRAIIKARVHTAQPPH